MKFRGLILLCFLGFNSLNFAQEISWTQFEDLNDSLRKHSKPIMIFIHTDWCKYCKMQENTTFKDPEVVDFLNSNFYNLELNAEQKKTITFLGRSYSKPLDDYHELAEFLSSEEKKITFPTTIFLNQHLEVELRKKGYQKKEDLILD